MVEWNYKLTHSSIQSCDHSFGINRFSPDFSKHFS